MPQFFIDRPIFAWVIAIGIIIAGLIAIPQLPIARYPQITPPAVTISANFPGASAEDAAQAVAAPIEQQLASLQGMLYYASTSSSDGPAASSTPGWSPPRRACCPASVSTRSWRTKWSSTSRTRTAWRCCGSPATST